MDCYKFEENITKFIDNELKQDFRKLFLNHHDHCNKCSEKFKNINSNILIFNKLPNLKTSNNFLDGLYQKIYDYNNNPSLWQRIRSLSIFEAKPLYIMGYAAGMLLVIFSSYSLFNIDTTNYNTLNEQVKASLNKNVNTDTPSLDIDQNYGMDPTLLAEADKPNVKKQTKFKNNQKSKTFNQPILPVSNNSFSKNANRNKYRNSSKKVDYSLKSINNMDNVLIDNHSYNDEEYIKNYERKNKYYQDRKDSLKKILINSPSIKIIEKVQEQIKKDSLEQLEFYRNFDKIQN